MRNIVVLNHGKYITAEMLPPALKSAAVSTERKAVVPNLSTTEKPLEHSEIVPLWLVEKDSIERAIQHCNDNIPHAAALLGVSPSTIYRKIQSWQKS